jgi:predicted ATP-grasp superfamily ATP-dependent carboligase
MAPMKLPASSTAPGSVAAGLPVIDEPRPAAYDVLVLDAATRQSLASVRSLGRAGLRVAAGECFAECDPRLPVLAFRSRYSARNVVLPSFSADASAFADGVVDFVREHPTSVVLPAMDGTIAAMTPRRAQLEALGCLLALPSDAALALANDKDRTLAIARDLGLHVPRTMRIDAAGEIPAMLAAFDFPFVLKPTMSWAARSCRRLQGREVISQAEARHLAQVFLAAGAGVLAQEWAGGRREGITLFVLGARVRASFAHVEHRTSPPLGGTSVLRESVPVPDDIYDAAVRLVTALGLEGLCEVEFRRDAAGQPLLMEVNARLAGPIEIAMRSGVDFPLMVWQWASGQPVDGADGYTTGLRMRWLRGDMRWLRDNYRQAGRPDGVSTRRALWTFAAEFARTPRYDCLDRHDLRPALAELRTTVAAIRKSAGTAGADLNRMGNSDDES